MELAFLILALLPLAVMPDFLPDDDDGEGDRSDEDGVELGPDHAVGDLLQPVIDDDYPDFETPDGDVLQPVPDQPDEPDFEQVGGDPLQPVIEDDVLGANARSAGDPYGEVAWIERFNPASDVLEIVVDQDVGGHAAEVETRPSTDGANGQVFLNGELYAVIRGAPGISAANVQLFRA